MRIMTLREAQQLIGRRVRYMRRGGNRFGWEGVIDYANTQKVQVLWDRTNNDIPVTQEYQMAALYRENGEDDNGVTYIMVLDKRNELSTGVATPEEDEELDRLGGKWRSPYEEAVERYHNTAYESQRPEETRPDWPLREVGRNIERFGKLLQDPKSTMSDLASAAHDAGLKLRLGIQPKMEETTNEGLQA